MVPGDIPRTKSLTIIAQDPSVKANGRIIRASVSVPAETVAPGPWGHRVQVIDYDASTNTLYAPEEPSKRMKEDPSHDPFTEATDAQLLANPSFHAQNVYAIISRTLARFEKALGRRVSWGFNGHQLKVAPHAFADANAFYAEKDEALVFGYFPASDGTPVFSCLSHDVVAHETTHALVDGLRTRFRDPSSPDQAGFHEGFADVVALLSIFSLPDIAGLLIDFAATGTSRSRIMTTKKSKTRTKRRSTIAKADVSVKSLRNSMLFGLAEQMGQELAHVRGQPLRSSAKLVPSNKYKNQPEFQEPHRRGELLVAAMMNAFLSVWTNRLESLGEVAPGRLDRERVIEEGADAADYLLTMAIRALDYTPPVHLEFQDYISALITADAELRPADEPFSYRQHLLDSFAAYGFAPASRGTTASPGKWDDARGRDLVYARTHFESMMRDPDEVYWFIWENREKLDIREGAFGHVISVRPCLRVGDDGFLLHETVAEFIQVLQITAAELPLLKLQVPKGMPASTRITLYGGNTLIFDEYGRLKFNIHNSITDRDRQSARIKYFWETGFYSSDGATTQSFSQLHLQRAMNTPFQQNTKEEW